MTDLRHRFGDEHLCCQAIEALINRKYQTTGPPNPGSGSFVPALSFMTFPDIWTCPVAEQCLDLFQDRHISESP